MPLFQNEFLDSLCIDPDNMLADLRKSGTNMTRKEIADLIGVSEHSIRRYESDWRTSKPPRWYYIILRFLSGDLSYFGAAWTDAKINYWNKKLTSPYAKYLELTPMDMNGRYAQFAQHYERQIKELSNELAELQSKHQHLVADHKLLQTKIQAYENEIALQGLHDQGIESGKVVSIGRHRRFNVGS